MELFRQLALYLESTPELHGQKLTLIRSFIQTPCTAQVAEEKFYDWAVEGMQILMDDFDLDPQDVEVAVCRDLARTYAHKELQLIRAGAYKELDMMWREALSSTLHPGTKVQIRQDGKEASGKFGTIMEGETLELLPTDPLVSDDEVDVRLEHDKIIKIPINRLDVVEAATIFAPGANLLEAGSKEKYRTDVEVELYHSGGLPPDVPKGSYLDHNQKVTIEWEMTVEARDWGIKGMSPMVPAGQEIELRFEEPTDDEDIEHKVKWKLNEVEATLQFSTEHEPLSLQILPISLHVDFSDNTAEVIFQVS